MSTTLPALLRPSSDVSLHNSIMKLHSPPEGGVSSGHRQLELFVRVFLRVRVRARVCVCNGRIYVNIYMFFNAMLRTNDSGAISTVQNMVGWRLGGQDRYEMIVMLLLQYVTLELK